MIGKASQRVSLASPISFYRNHLAGNSGKLYLYGSRTDDDLRGGDIDLLLVVTESTVCDELLSKKHYILADIKEKIGEQRIDLGITTEAELKQNDFYQAIFPKAILK